MRWILLMASLSLTAMTPIYTDYGNERVKDEFRNIYSQSQPKQYEFFRSTPILSELQDKQLVIVSSGGWSTLMWRDNQEIYVLKGSCVTVRR